MELTGFETNKNFKMSFADNFNILNKYKCFSIIEKLENNIFEKNDFLDKNFMRSNESKNDYKERYKVLLNNLKKKKIIYRSNAIVWICKNCGYTHIGMEAPLICPICNLPQNYFELQHEA